LKLDSPWDKSEVPTLPIKVNPTYLTELWTLKWNQIYREVKQGVARDRSFCLENKFPPFFSKIQRMWIRASWWRQAYHWEVLQLKLCLTQKQNGANSLRWLSQNYKLQGAMFSQ
jgi:hypothetical protein